MSSKHPAEGGADPVRGALHAKARRRRAAVAKVGEVSGEVSVGARATGARNDLPPRLEFVERAPGELKAPARNARKLDPDHVAEVAAAITALGFCDPVLIDRDGLVLDGTVRVEAAKRLGLPCIPCIVAGHLTASERKLLRLALNRLQEKGAWDLDELKLEFQELELEGAALDVTGFSGPEIDFVLLDEAPTSDASGPLTPAPDAEAVTRAGDLFRLGEHRLACGDGRDRALVRELVGEDLARLVLTDVPYNVPVQGHVSRGAHREFAMGSGEMSEAEFAAFNRAWIEAAVGHLRDGGILGTFIDWRGHPCVHAAALSQGLAGIALVVWAKTNPGMGSLYRSQHELLPLFKKGRAPHVNNVRLGRHGRPRSNLWTYAGASSIGSEARQGLSAHPTVKPTAMLVDALLDLTNGGDLVLDPFLGSGSTLLACEEVGRRCRGIEIDPLYVDLAIGRYEAATGKSALLEATGETFEALRQGRNGPTER